MSLYFIDTEFLEGSQKTLFGKTKPTIDLISIGIVAEDGREYYAISKDFNLKEAWNRYDLVDDNSVGVRIGCSSPKKKVYWIRENVLKPIFNEWVSESFDDCAENGMFASVSSIEDFNMEFNYSEFKVLLKKYGKTNKQIAEEIKEYIFPKIDGKDATNYYLEERTEIYKPQFYGYYADYDWVAFCWLFGKMMNLPKGFPMYCNDLKQELDRKAKNKIIFQSFEEGLKSLKTDERYPKQTNEHNALADAKWNYELYKFIQSI